MKTMTKIDQFERARLTEGEYCSGTGWRTGGPGGNIVATTAFSYPADRRPLGCNALDV